AKRVEDQQQHATACTEGQSQLNGLLEKQTHVAERLQRLAAGLERSAALAPLSDAWTVYRERLQQLMLIGNRLNKGQTELPQLEERATTAAERFTQ
ncbi:hypothetical protein, partial [Pseudomonas viridiflava]